MSVNAIRSARPAARTAALPMPELVGILAAELDRLCGRAEALQHVLHLDHGEALPAGAFEAVQDLDLLTQELQGLGAFARSLARLMPHAWQIDPAEAAGDVRVSRLKARLTGGAEACAASSGDLDLF